MEATLILTNQDVRRGEQVTLVSPRNPTPTETVYLSNIDQTVAFPVETVFFYKAHASPASDIVEKVQRSVAEKLLIPYYFLAGRLSFNPEAKRLELVCNNAGVHFVGAASELRLDELGNLSLPNPSFQHLILRPNAFKSLAEAPLFTIQVTRFKCGGFSIGFITNHSILDGRSAAAMLESLASICRGEGMRAQELSLDRSCIRARDPPQIKFHHPEYTKSAEASLSTFTSAHQTSPDPSSLPALSENFDYECFTFTASMISQLKEKSATRCSSFEAIVAHLWRARAKAVFHRPSDVSSVLFAVDIRSKMSPPLPDSFIGNAVISACASAPVLELDERPFSFSVEKVREAIERVTDEYVRSSIDWLEVHKGMPAIVNGNFFVSAWWKLPFHELDFGFGKPLYGGPVVSGMDEFVLLLSDGSGGGGINVWISLEKGKMKRFSSYVSVI